VARGRSSGDLSFQPPDATTADELVAAMMAASSSSFALRTASDAQSPSAICFALAFSSFFVSLSCAGSRTFVTALSAWRSATSPAM
jgi:hypothetical protein